MLLPLGTFVLADVIAMESDVITTQGECGFFFFFFWQMLKPIVVDVITKKKSSNNISYHGNNISHYIYNCN